MSLDLHKKGLDLPVDLTYGGLVRSQSFEMKLPSLLQLFTGLPSGRCEADDGRRNDNRQVDLQVCHSRLDKTQRKHFIGMSAVLRVTSPCYLD